MQQVLSFRRIIPAVIVGPVRLTFLAGARESPASPVIGDQAYVGTGQGGGDLKDIWEFNPAK